MIDQSQLTTTWIQQIAKEHKTDPLLIEKSGRALLLLEGLAKQNLPLVFMGGTALMLHFGSTKRLSIDIDIIFPGKQSDLENILAGLTGEQDFNRWERQERQSSTAIPKKHYKLYYEPLYKTHKEEEYVLLDVLMENIRYAEINKLPVQSRFVPQHGDPIHVETASIEDLLGDKLTAFAPYTMGIPYVKGTDSMSMEIIKQLYDIGNLFDAAKQFEIVKATFRAIAKTELAYRKQGNLTTGDVLDDIYQTSLSVATRGQGGKADFEELQSGIKRVKDFIFSESYHIEKAITDASKAAYLATIIRKDGTAIEKFIGPSQMKNWIIESPMNTKLNKLKKSNLEAFFYWHKIYELQTK